MTSRSGCGIGHMPDGASAHVRWQGARLAVSRTPESRNATLLCDHLNFRK